MTFTLMNMDKDIKINTNIKKIFLEGWFKMTKTHQCDLFTWTYKYCLNFQCKKYIFKTTMTCCKLKYIKKYLRRFPDSRICILPLNLQPTQSKISTTFNIKLFNICTKCQKTTQITIKAKFFFWDFNDKGMIGR